MGRLLPDPNKGVLGEILGVMGVFHIGQSDTIYRRTGTVVQLCQSLPAAGGYLDQQPVQRLPVLFARSFRCLCHKQHQHGPFLLSFK